MSRGKITQLKIHRRISLDTDPGGGADTTLPIGGSTARVMPLSPLLTALYSHPDTVVCVSLFSPPSLSLFISVFLSLSRIYTPSNILLLPLGTTKYVCHAFSVELLYKFLASSDARSPCSPSLSLLFTFDGRISPTRLPFLPSLSLAYSRPRCYRTIFLCCF